MASKRTLFVLDQVFSCFNLCPWVAVYANSLLGTLNARKMLREKAGLASTYNDVAELSNLDRDIHSHVVCTYQY